MPLGSEGSFLVLILMGAALAALLPLTIWRELHSNRYHWWTLH